MMRFNGGEYQEIYNRIFDVLSAAFIRHNIKLVRADHYHMKDCDDLFLNVEIIMHGCDFGVAIFERISGGDWNENVAIETGYMMAMRKPVMLLKEGAMKTLPTDLLGKKYVEFNHTKPDLLNGKVDIWLRQNITDLNCNGLLLYATLDISDWNYSLQKRIADIACDLLGGQQLHFVGIFPSTEAEYRIAFRTTSIIQDFQYKSALAKLPLDRSGIIISSVSVTDASRFDDITSLDLVIDPPEDQGNPDYLIQICTRGGFSGLEDFHEYVRDRGLLGETTTNFRKMKILITKRDGVFIIQSNLILPGADSTTKLMARRIRNVRSVLRCLTGWHTFDCGYAHELMKYNDKDILYMLDIEKFPDSDPFDMMGATNKIRIRLFG